MSEDWIEEAKKFFECRDDDVTQPLFVSGGAINEKTEENHRKRLAKVEKNIKNITSFNGLKKLLQGNTVIEDNYSAESNDNELRCIFWNCGGLISKLEKTTTFLEYVTQKRPDIIFLNELKCLEEKFGNGDNEETTVKKLARFLDYECIYVPSTSENGRSKRGSAILYRKNAEEKF
ncbi:unnamed protein product, partial [Mesorhabditis belari]|uniref:Endonuclease/exonuclease/phosphatase domain-containing protein n=1 Tax=Mesorhabditis belari TaxID=2138241 RepID=A0AAF3EKR3_9BILA